MATAGSSPYLNYELIDKQQLDPAEVRRVAAAAAAEVPHVARVYTRDQLLRGEVRQRSHRQRVVRGFNAQRSGDLEIILEPYWMRQAQGTTHGTPYNYDAHIPLILMGPRIKPGRTRTRSRSTISRRRSRPSSAWIRRRLLRAGAHRSADARGGARPAVRLVSATAAL